MSSCLADTTVLLRMLTVKKLEDNMICTVCPNS